MKKFLLVFGIALAAAPAFAQTIPAATPVPQETASPERHSGAKMSPEDRAAMYTKELQSKLNLTPDQTQKIMAVNTECIRRKDAMKAGGAGAGGGFRDIAQYRRQQFATILTPDQMTRLQAMNQERREMRNAAPGMNAKSTGGQDMNDAAGK